MKTGPGSRVPSPEFLRLLIVALVALAVASIFIPRFVLIELNVRRLGAPALLALAEVMAILGVGRGAQTLLSRLFGSETSASPHIRTDFVAGYPLFGVLCFLIGVISTRAVVMAAALVAGVVAGAWALRQYTRRKTVMMELSFSTWIALAVLLIAAASGFLTAQLPAATLDEVAYHLAAPRIWVNEGRVVDLPLLSHSYFPFAIESADIPLLALLGADGAIASHFVHLLAAFATAFLIFSWLQKRVSAGFALAGTAALVTTPALLVTSGWSWNEWPLLGICVALLSELDQERPNRSAVAVLIAAGLLTKYSFPLVAIVLLLARRDKALIRPAVIGAVAGSVFFIRNLVLTGNPLAPFLGPLAPEVAAYRTGWSGYIFDGAFIDESLGIALIPLALAAVALLPADAFLRFASLGLAVAAVAVALGRPSSRLLLPLLVPLAMIALVSLPQIRSVRWSATVVATLQLFLSLIYIARLQPFDLLAGRVSDTEYLATQRQSISSVLWIDAQLPPNSRTLVLGVNELFWFSKPVRGGGNFDSNRIAANLRDTDLEGKLRREKISHIAVAGDGLRVGSAPLSKKDQERVTTLDAEAAINLREFMKARGELVASRGNDAVYAIR